MIIDCPTLAHLNTLTNGVTQSRIFSDYFAKGTHANEVTFIVHVSPMDVFQAPSYAQWRQKFATNVQVRKRRQSVKCAMRNSH
jgi:hypothetical protein